MSRLVSLAEAISLNVHDGDFIALEGFTHLIPFAAGHEIIRQKKRNLTAVRLTPDLIYDQMIGAGCISKLIFSWGGNPGVGSLHRFRDAISNQWPNSIEFEEHTHAGLTNRYLAGASGLPFTVMKGYAGTNLVDNTKHVAFIDSPFGNEKVTAIAAINPDVTIVHAQQADRNNNVMMWGILGSSREAIFSAKRVVITVEEVVDEFTPHENSMVIPEVLINAIALAPKGAAPSYASGYYDRDNDAYIAWDEISKERETFNKWLDDEIFKVVKS